MHIRKFLSGFFEKSRSSLLLLGIYCRHYACIRGGYIALKERAQPFSKIPLILAYGLQDATVLSKGSPFMAGEELRSIERPVDGRRILSKVLLFFDICKYKMHATAFFCHFGIFYPVSPSFSAPSSAVHLFLCFPKNAILFAYSKNLLYLCTRNEVRIDPK